jgi:hypothetical protein
MDFQYLGKDEKEIVAALHQIILAHWNEGAAAAWISFQAHGRGAVLLDFRSFDEPPDQLPLAGYIRAQDIKSDSEDVGELRRLIESYEPEQAVLFVIYTPLGDTIIELVTAFEGRLTPPQALAQQSSGVN